VQEMQFIECAAERDIDLLLLNYMSRPAFARGLSGKRSSRIFTVGSSSGHGTRSTTLHSGNPTW